MSSGADLFSPKRADSKIQITAELTTNHLGDLSRAKSMMRLAQSQGATLVKFQMRDVETFYKKDVLEGAYPSPFGGTFREYRLGLELSDEDFVEIDEYASKIGLGWFASVLDEISLERAITLKLPMIKIPSTISRKRDFILNVANRYDGELVFSTGMTSPEYVQWLLDILGTERKLYLLHTNSAYPTPQEDCNVSVVSSYAKLTEKYANVIPGYSSHDDGWLGSALAIASGARMIEKHVKLGSQSWVHFDSVALDLETNEFQIYVDSLRRAEKILGEPQKKITPSEHHKY
jgi:N-acetylneuraminate synthase